MRDRVLPVLLQIRLMLDLENGLRNVVDENGQVTRYSILCLNETVGVNWFVSKRKDGWWTTRADSMRHRCMWRWNARWMRLENIRREMWWKVRTSIWRQGMNKRFSTMSLWRQFIRHFVFKTYRCMQSTSTRSTWYSYLIKERWSLCYSGAPLWSKGLLTFVVCTRLESVKVLVWELILFVVFLQYLPGQSAVQEVYQRKIERTSAV